MVKYHNALRSSVKIRGTRNGRPENRIPVQFSEKRLIKTLNDAC